ncbi:50S ribosomal protein L31e [Candidatus Woesearchaeota archaeon]|nr:50S ribosomal protein L31e [Candidatus Woesearchaeota archaeon]
MALERIYTIPLRREFMKAPNYRKTKRSVSAVREFLQKHMKCEEVKIGKYLNLELWKHGRKNPPPKIQVKAIKDKVKIKDKEIEIVKAELLNAPIEFQKETKKEKTPVIQAETKDDKLELEKKEVLMHEEKKETKMQMQEETKTKDFLKHEKESTQQVQEKMRSQEIITSPQKPRHEHHDSKGKKK